MGQRLNSGTKSPKTVLHRACEQREKGMIRIIRWLVQAGADVNALSSNRMTPTMLAAKKANLETIKILVDASANIDIVSENQTAYDFAMANKHKLTCQYLVKRMDSKHQKTRKDVVKGQTMIKDDVSKNNIRTDENRMEETSINQVQTNFNAANGQTNTNEDLTRDQQTERQNMIEQQNTQDMAVSGRMEETSIGQVQTDFVAPMKQTNIYENLSRDQQTDNQDMFEAEMTQNMAVSCRMEEDTVNNYQTQQIVTTISTGITNLAGQLGKKIMHTLDHHIAKINEKGELHLEILLKNTSLSYLEVLEYIL